MAIEKSSSQLAGALDFLKDVDDGAERFALLAQGIINNLFVLLRSVSLHELHNDALIKPFQNMADTVNGFLELFHEPVAVQLVDGNFFVNKNIIRLDFSTFENAHYLMRMFDFLKINEILFSEKVDRPILSKMAVTFLEVFRDKHLSIFDYNLDPISVRKIRSISGEEIEQAEDPRSQILITYASGLLMLRQFVNDLRKGRAPKHAKVKRLCLELIDVEPRLHNILLSMIHLEAYKGNLFSHMLNTAILSLVFGQRIGLRRPQLVDLGMAAFHHDLGWALMGAMDEEEVDDAQGDVALDMDGINYIRNNSDTAMDEIRTKVARSLVRLGGFNEMVINRLIVAYECQIPEDKPPEGLYYSDIGASFMTHVVRMASTYDELTTPRPDKPALLPDEAMKVILDDGGKTFDLFLAKLFANSLGAYPIGTMVEMDTAEIGMVVNLPREPVDFYRPQVRILIDNMGAPVRDGAIVDLAERRRGRYLRSIERTLDSRIYGVNITYFFFGAAQHFMAEILADLEGQDARREAAS